MIGLGGTELLETSPSLLAPVLGHNALEVALAAVGSYLHLLRDALELFRYIGEAASAVAHPSIGETRLDRGIDWGWDQHPGPGSQDTSNGGHCGDMRLTFEINKGNSVVWRRMR